MSPEAYSRKVPELLHTHPKMEEELGVDIKHVIVDVDDRKQMLKDNRALRAQVQYLQDTIDGACV